MKHAFARKLYQYWNEIRACRLGVPDRAAFDPMRIPALLPYILIIDNDGADIGRVRLSGTGIQETYARELSGSNFFDLFCEDDRSLVDEVFNDLRNDEFPVSVASTMLGPQGNIASEFLFLPMKSSKGRQIIAIQAFDEIKWWYGHKAPGAARVVAKRTIKPETDIRLADVFSAPAEANVIEFARRGRVPLNARKVGPFSVIEGGAI